jgi:hypothetical protein
MTLQEQLQDIGIKIKCQAKSDMIKKIVETLLMYNQKESIDLILQTFNYRLYDEDKNEIMRMIEAKK